MPRKITPDDLLAIELAGEPQLSPDGRKLAYVVARIDKEKNETRRQIFMAEAVPGARPMPFTTGTRSDQSPRWSPDGTRLAFISSRSGKNQVWVMQAFGGEARQLTHFKDGVRGDPVWSPDGQSIAFTATVSAAGPELETDKDDDEDLFRKYTRGVKRVTRISYKLDGEGLHDPEKHQQVFVVNVGDERPTPLQITRGPWNHRTPAWAPDAGSIAFVANRRADDDYFPFYDDIWVQDLAAPSVDPVRITPGTFSLGHPAWAPDGSRIAFLGFEYDKAYQGYSNTRVWAVGRDGTGLARIDTGWDRSMRPAAIYDMPAPGGIALTWTPDGSALIAMGSDEGRQQVYAVDVESGSITALTAGDHCVTSWSCDARCRKLAVGLTRPDVPADIFLVEGPDLLRVTHVNEDLLAELELAPVEAFTFQTAEGRSAFLERHGRATLDQAEGWVMKPVEFEESKRYPAILEVHGGPMGMYGWAFFMEFQCLAAMGYAIVYTNPRGSQGYSEQFCACIQADWGNLDYLDVMAGLDSAIERFPWIDRDRLGVAGGSYGGFMTNWTVGHTERFKAAITMRSVVNEASSVGTSDLGFVDMMPYPNTPVSPLTFAERITTPLLIEHQEDDLRCPIEQAEQLYTALKALRRPVEFVRYPESSHGMSRTGKPWLRVHRLRTILQWFQRHIH